MATRTIIKWPNPRLSIVTNDVDPAAVETKALALDLIDSMHSELGLGLASTQVGIDKSVCVICAHAYPNSRLAKDPILSDAIVLVNPVVKVDESAGVFSWKEACLSIEDISAEVTRYKKITLTYSDLMNTQHIISLENDIAGVVQHETDHLIGKVFIDRLSTKKRRKVISKILSKKREIAACLKKQLKKEKKELMLENAQKDAEIKPGFRKFSSTSAKSKRKKVKKVFGKNKRRK